jgi:hypothetical protein
VQEFSTPAAVTVEPAAALTDAVEQRAASSPDSVLFARKTATAGPTSPPRSSRRRCGPSAAGLVAEACAPATASRS